MSQVRETIGLLVKVVEPMVLSKCKAEWFRLAKFNSKDIVESFWKLLYELVLYLDTGNVAEDLDKHLKQNCTEAIVRYTKQSLQDRGYCSAEFSQLPDDMSNGSRELLLAFGWLLSTQGVIDKFLERYISPLEAALPSSQTVRVNVPMLAKGTMKVPSIQKVQQMQLVNGKLHLTLKQLYALHRTTCKMKHKVHMSTEGVCAVPGRTHLSLLETTIIRHPEQLKMMIQQLEHENVVLNNVMLWKENEHNFWKWMESVLALKLEEAESAQAETDEPLIHYNISAQLLNTLGGARKKLEAAILSNEPAITQLEELWNSKQSEATKADLLNLDIAITAEMDYQSRTVAQKIRKRDLPMCLMEPNFMFSKPVQNKGKSVFIPELHTLESEQQREPVNIELEIATLQAQIARLELEMARKERLYCEKLDKLSATIPSAVCIQPSSVS